MVAMIRFIGQCSDIYVFGVPANIASILTLFPIPVNAHMEAQTRRAEHDRQMPLPA